MAESANTQTRPYRAGAISAALDAMATGELSSRALLEQAEANANKHKALNPIALVDWDLARARADELDSWRKRLSNAGAAIPALLGVPLTVKDLFSVKAMPMKAGTEAPLPRFDGDESTLVTRMKNAGGLIFAKTNMHEIALGATGENEWTGDVCNPFNPAHQAGGSSSGAGVCAATGIGLGGVGSDTGGSVRIPAAFCSVAGFKPSFGAIPLDNALYLSWTCDHAGPLAPTVDDCARLYEVMAGRSARHGAIARRPKLGIPAAWLKGRLSESVREHFDRALADLKANGAEIVDCPLPDLPLAWICYSPIVRAEAATVHKEALQAGGQGFSASVLAPMQAGQKISAVEYLEAMQMRDRVSADLAQTLKSVDALLLPTTAVTPPKRGQTEVDVIGGKMSVREAVLGQTLPFSLCGLPALTVPAELCDELPVGLSLVGARGSDAAVLGLGGWLENQFEPRQPSQ
ncbi:MAG: amidase [Burkholderiaceae bacterium]